MILSYIHTKTNANPNMHMNSVMLQAVAPMYLFKKADTNGVEFLTIA